MMSKLDPRSAPAKPQCCILYLTDSQYLFPTLVSAMQARQHASRDKADVIIFCLDLTEQARRLYTPICDKTKVGLISVPSHAVEGQNAMLARLFLNRFVPGQYTQYLYLDGDVHILDSLDPLIDAPVPEGHFLAANDPFTFLLGERGAQSRDLDRHLGSLGFDGEQRLRYFNSGVLRIHRTGWEEIGQRAWEYYTRFGRTPRFPDQDALNVVAMEQRLPLSLSWNYPVFLRNCRLSSEIQPKIKHFMSRPKPWQGVFPPWSQEAYAPYEEAIRRFPQLAPYSMKMKGRERAIYHLQQRAKKMTETLTWGFSKRRGRILNYEALCLRAEGSMPIPS